MNILIQGPPGTGKTTLIVKLAKLLKNPQGFYTEEIRNERGERVGFCVRSFEGKEAILAHVNFKGKKRVGKYKVDVESFEKIALEVLRENTAKEGLFLIDEIGKMEMFSPAFRKKVKKLLESPATVIATIPQKMPSNIKNLLEGEKFQIIRITKENRDRLLFSIINLIPDVHKK